MINKENNNNSNNSEEKKDEPKTGFVDTAKMAASGHILIKDKDTGKVLLNRRG